MGPLDERLLRVLHFFFFYSFSFMSIPLCIILKINRIWEGTRTALDGGERREKKNVRGVTKEPNDIIAEERRERGGGTLFIRCTRRARCPFTFYSRRFFFFFASIFDIRTIRSIQYAR